MIEETKPIPVRGPESSRTLFFIRQIFDLQLKTIVFHLRTLLPTFRGTVLDIGAGESPWRFLMDKSVSYQGLDIKSADKFGMSEQKDVIYYEGTIYPFSNSTFDAAICVEVLEHSSNPDLLLSEAFRVLRPGGIFILTVPWSARLHYKPFDFNRFTRYKLNEMLTQAGFIDIAIRERGNDICAVANKMVIITWRLTAAKKDIFYLLNLYLIISCLFITTIFILCAHITLLLNLGSRDDPLGYFVECRKK
jgi:SAM-dependent methyltransferase